MIRKVVDRAGNIGLNFENCDLFLGLALTPQPAHSDMRDAQHVWSHVDFEERAPFVNVDFEMTIAEIRRLVEGRARVITRRLTTSHHEVVVQFFGVEICLCGILEGSTLRLDEHCIRGVDEVLDPIEDSNVEITRIVA